MYQRPKCPYSYFSLALTFNVRVLFPCEKRLENIKQSAISVHLLQCNCSISTGDFNILATDWVRLNYASQNMSTNTHHHPPPPTTSQNMSITTHHHPPPAKIYPPLPTISQKMDCHPARAKIYSYITSFRHCFNSSFFFEMQYSFP